MIESLTVVKMMMMLLSSSALTSVVTWLLTRKRKEIDTQKVVSETDKLNAETEHVVVTGYKALVDDLQEEMERIKQRVSELEKEVSKRQLKEQDCLERLEEVEAENSHLLNEIQKLKQHHE